MNDISRLTYGLLILKNYMVGDYNITPTNGLDGRKKGVKFHLTPSTMQALRRETSAKEYLEDAGFVMCDILSEDPYCFFPL